MMILAMCVQAVPVDTVLAKEMLAIGGMLHAAAPADAYCGTQAARDWLRESGCELLKATDVPLITAFCRMMQWHHKRVAALQRHGATVSHYSLEAATASAGAAGGLALPHLAALMLDAGEQPMSLAERARAVNASGAAACDASADVCGPGSRGASHATQADGVARDSAVRAREVPAAASADAESGKGAEAQASEAAAGGDGGGAEGKLPLDGAVVFLHEQFQWYAAMACGLSELCRTKARPRDLCSVSACHSTACD